MRLSLFLCSLALLLSSQPSVAQGPTWYTLERRVEDALAERELRDWVDELSARPMPTELEPLFERLQVAARSGRDAEVERVLVALAQLPPEVGESRLHAIGHFFLEREDWGNARRAFEQLSWLPPSGARALLDHMSASRGAAETDDWLEARALANEDWWPSWVVFRCDAGLALDELQERCAGRVRADPASLDSYLNVLTVLGTERDDLAWLPEFVQPEGALASHRLGARLAGRWPEVARHYLEQSLAQELSAREARELEWMFPVALGGPSESLETSNAQRLDAWNIRALAKVCRVLGDARAAQDWLGVLLLAHGPDLLEGFYHEAGSIQALSGARVVQGQLQQAESEDSDQASYWLKRADYYRGRAESEQERKALERALELARADSGPRAWRALDRWASWLYRHEGTKAVSEFWLGEFEAAEDDPDFAARALNELHDNENDFKPSFDPTRSSFWSFLRERAEWDRLDELLLWAMAHHILAGNQGDSRGEESEPALDRLWSRAESLARVGSASRSRILGWVMTRSGANRRALPLLRAALAGTDEERVRGEVAWNLSEAHLALGEWEAAGRLELDLRAFLTPRGLGLWRASLALCAAQRGEREAALGIWRRHSEFDRADLRSLERLADAGMHDLLVEFYAHLAVADPASSAARRALARLR